MTSVSSIQSLILDLPPSCIAFCPTQPEFFVVGTYHLHRAEDPTSNEITAEVAAETTAQQTRSGTLILFQLRADTISQLSAVESSGAVLDIQWKPLAREHGGEGEGEDVLAVATSVGRIEFYDLRIPGDGEKRSATLVPSKQYESIQVADTTVLVLSLTWHPSHSNVVGFTLSDGRVLWCRVSPPNSAGISPTIHEIYTHDLEAWTLSFVSPPQNTDTLVLSGGDDAVLSCSSIDLSTHVSSETNTPHQRWIDRGRSHMAGVTAILPLTTDLVLTGSYDDRIRLFSGYLTGRIARLETETDLGGGVWRLKVLEVSSDIESERREDASTSFVILASCMHAGTRVVRLSRVVHDGAWGFDVLAKFEEHRSMNYGSDFQPTDWTVNNESRGRRVRSIISTSFYDKLLCLWRVDLSELERESG